MDIQLRQLMQKHVPPVNLDIVNGLAVKHMPQLEEYIDRIIMGVSTYFPESFKYLGCARCSPLEEYRVLIKSQNQKNENQRKEFDVSRTDFYMMKYFFSFNGEELKPKYVRMPFVSSSGSVIISGTRWSISPVLYDKVISINAKDIFIRVLRDKLTFNRVAHNIVINDRRETTQVVWGSIYHLRAELKKQYTKTTNAQSTIMHYLLCKFGFTQTFVKFCKATPIVGNEDINIVNYPPDKYVICKSTQQRIKTPKKDPWTPTEIRVAFKIEEFTPHVKTLIGNFFYIVDHFPTMLPKEYLDSHRQWIILMGNILFSGTRSVGVLFDDVSEHIQSLDQYLDTISQNQLKEIGHNCEDIYSLLYLVLSNFDEWIVKSADKVCSMYDKELNILYFISEEFIKGIHSMHYDLRKASKKQLNINNVTKILARTIKTGVFFKIIKRNAAASILSYSGDNKFFKITCNLSSQSSANPLTGKKTKQQIDDPAKRLHISVAEVGGFANLPKNEPSGRSRINPHLKTDARQTVLRDPDKVMLLDKVQAMIERD
jgi:hypothetical protein